ncbi:MAG: hypothetical protein Q7O66_16720 [Dehalococcoidia bacterium]|nr:hypothetical protein [Dehalococcoidia bacterium]
MSEKPNIFERRRDLLESAIGRRVEAVNNAFGVGERPFNGVKLSPQERVQYFASLPDPKKLELWQQMGEAEQQEIRDGLQSPPRQGP